MIELKDIRVEFNRGGEATTAAVDGVSLSIKKGEVFGIIGSSGAGKSTLVRTINHLQKPTAGEIVIDGVSLNGEAGSGLRAARANIGMIFQHFNLWNAKTVGNNVAFPLKCAGWSKEARDVRVDEVLAFVGLLDKKNAYPQSLSGGQKQRVAIARALASHAHILLCDEPTSALDVETTSSVLKVLERANEEFGITIVVITHELEVVKSICDRVAVMSAGKVVECGDVYEIFARPCSETAQALVHESQGFDVPRELYEQEGTLLKLTYAGENATDPVLFEASSCFDVSLSILHGRIEYIAHKPLGVLYVLAQGSAVDVHGAISYLRGRVESLEVVRRAG